jgi:hypothetical protein
VGLRPDSLSSYSCDLVGKPADVSKKFLAARESLLYFAVEAASMEPSGDARRLLVGYGLRGGALEAAADA